jgi:hypothetical protein
MAWPAVMIAGTSTRIVGENEHLGDGQVGHDERVHGWLTFVREAK